MISTSNKHRWLIVLPFIVLGFLIYSNTFDAPFHYDDLRVVSELSFEEMVKKCAAGGSRFICHLTFLLNYWMGGTDVLGYHIINILIHIGTAYFVFIFLFQILSVSNSKSTPASNQYTDGVLPPLTDPIFWPALFGGILFLVHPLATQAVTYIAQRYTSLVGFFYIGSLAFFVSARTKFKEDERFFKKSHLIRYLCSFIMAVLAMRTKEMAITLPATMLLTEYYFIQSDLKLPAASRGESSTVRNFVISLIRSLTPTASGSESLRLGEQSAGNALALQFRAAGKRILYLLPLLSTGLIIPVSDMIGVETISLESVAALQDYTWGAGINRKEYLLTQFKIIPSIYLKLFVWPIGQNIDHDYVVSKTLFDLPTMASFLTLCVILGIGLWLFKRSKLVSFGILWFFVTISPTSSIVPNIEFVTEHRAYISLMGLAFAAAGLPAWKTRWKHYFWVFVPILLLLSGLTYARNKVWQTDVSLWKDAVKKSPKRARPYNNLGVALADDGKNKEAIARYSEAIRINPGYPDAHYNLAIALVDEGKNKEAIAHYSKAIRINPNFANAHYNLGNALVNLGSLKDAIRHYSEALRIDPSYAEAHYNLGIVLTEQGKINEAIRHYSEALRINPSYVEAHYNLGNALIKLESPKEAIRHYSEAIRINPDHVDAHYNLGLALANEGKNKEAIAHYSEAIRIKPDYTAAHYNLGNALINLGSLKDAIRHYSEVLRIKPDFAEAHYNLGNALIKLGSINEAIRHYSEALRIQPDYVEALNNIGNALAMQGNLKEAISHLQEALRIKPDYTEAQNNMDVVLRLMDKSAGTSNSVETP